MANSNMTTVSTEVEQQLIDGVRDRVCLWDKSSDGYKNKVVRESGWREMGVELGMTGVKVKELWASLRSQFMRFRKKLQNPSGSGNGRRPFFRHEDALKFLVEIIEPDESTFTNLEVDTIAPIFDSQELHEAGVELNDFDSSLSNTVGNTRNPPESLTSSTSITSITPQVPRYKENDIHRRHAKFGRKRSLEETKTNDFDRDVLKIMAAGVAEDDEYDSLGKVFAKKLRCLGSKNRRTFLDVEFQINSILHEAEMKLLE